MSLVYQNGLYEAIRTDGNRVVVLHDDDEYEVELIHSRTQSVISCRKYVGRNDFLRHLPTYGVTTETFKTL